MIFTLAPWDSNLNTKKSASGKRPPDEAHLHRSKFKKNAALRTTTQTFVECSGFCKFSLDVNPMFTDIFNVVLSLEFSRNDAGIAGDPR